MNVSDALKKRKSVRAYLAKDVEKEKIEHILNCAKHAPSGVNTQPWQVCVVRKDAKKRLDEKMINAFLSNEKENMDYQYYPLVWSEVYKNRRKETGLQMYKTLEITREDKDKQLKQWTKNYDAFGAPVVLYFFIDKDMEKGSYIDYGMFLQSIALVAVELGLSTCIQASLAQYPDLVKEELNIPKDKVLLCGIALGYEDKDDVVNSYRTSRVEINEFCEFYE